MGPLQTLTHDLVAVWFGFQSATLPFVYHKLCVLLTNILHAHVVFSQWHDEHCKDQPDPRLEGIRDEFDATRPVLWKHCKVILTWCLDEYLSFSLESRRQQQQEQQQQPQPSECDADHRWWLDLEGLHRVWQLTNQFLLLCDKFLYCGIADYRPGDCPSTAAARLLESDDSELGKTRCDIFRKHLRRLHVAAMNGLGSKLSRES